jgi:hypothetical protein
MAATRLVSKELEKGRLVIVRYRDHVRFENADSTLYKPWTLEAVGWVDHEDDDCIRIVNERYSEPRASGNARLRSTGVSIVKSTIVELRKIKADGDAVGV